MKQGTQLRLRRRAYLEAGLLLRESEIGTRDLSDDEDREIERIIRNEVWALVHAHAGKLASADLSPAQQDTLDAMKANRSPWCLNKNTAAALLRRGLIVAAGVCCEHRDPTYVLAPKKDPRR